MSLSTDIFFVKALRSSGDITSIVGNRIFNSARDERSEMEDKIPYITVILESVRNDSSTKDEGAEGDMDIASVAMLVVAKDREQLAQLTTLVRKSVRDAFESQDPDNDDMPFYIEDYTFNASAAEYDPFDNPCFFQVLTYQCETYNK